MYYKGQEERLSFISASLDVRHAPSHRVAAVLEKLSGGFDKVQAAFDVRESRFRRRFDHLVDRCVEAPKLAPDHENLFAIPQYRTAC